MRPRFKHLSLAVLLLAAMAVGATQAIGSSSASSAPPNQPSSTEPPPPPTAPNPYASYRPPTGPTLSDEAIRSAALTLAAAAGDARPSAISAVNTNLVAAMQSADKRFVPSAAQSPEEASYEQSAVVLTVLHGQFTLNVSVPKGEPEPSGSMLFLVLDAHTGALDFRGVASTEPAGLTALSAMRPLD
jgi:hypothetical protein